jgi:hypothetical protein
MSSCQNDHETDHGRVASCGAWFALIPVMALLGFIDAHLTSLSGWVVDWGVFLTICGVVARWKRCPAAWWSFAGIAVLCVASAIYKTTFWSSSGAITQPDWYAAVGILFCWYWLIRSGRKEPAAPRAAVADQHIYHHVIHHGAEQEALAPPVTATVEGVVRQVGGAPKAIEAAKVVAGSVLGASPVRIKRGRRVS